MPKFLAGCQYIEEINRHLKKNIEYWLDEINGNKFATGQILRKAVEVVEGRLLGGWAQKSPEPWTGGSSGLQEKHPSSIVLEQSMEFTSNQ